MRKFISILCLLTFSLVTFYGYGPGELVCKPVSDPSKCGYIIDVISGCDVSPCEAMAPEQLDDFCASGSVIVVVVDCGERMEQMVEPETYCSSCASDNLSVADCEAIAGKLQCCECSVKESRYEPLFSNEIRVYEVKISSRTITGFAGLERQLDHSYIFKISRPFGIHNSISSTVLIC